MSTSSDSLSESSSNSSSDILNEILEDYGQHEIHGHNCFSQKELWIRQYRMALLHQTL